MSCSACIDNPKKFLATSTRRLILLKNLPPVYHDELLGNLIYFEVTCFPNIYILIFTFRFFTSTHLEKQPQHIFKLSKFNRKTSSNAKNNPKQEDRY